MQETNLKNLVINKVENQEVYYALKTNGQIQSDELYLVGGGSSVDSVNGQTGDVNLDIPVVHKVESQDAYDEMAAAGQVNAGELYLVPGDDSSQINTLTNGDVKLVCGGDDGTEYLEVSSTTDEGSVLQLYSGGIYMVPSKLNNARISPTIGFCDSDGNIKSYIGVTYTTASRQDGTYDRQLDQVMIMGQYNPVNIAAREETIIAYGSGGITLRVADDSGGKITLDGPVVVPVPTEDLSPATKQYVDEKISDKELILASSTSGSTKKFKITVDDNGTISATEI